jgi:PCI domain
LFDPLLGTHVWALVSLIRSRAVVLYFQPFATIRLERMSAAFGWTVEYTESEVVALIQRGDILGRVDSQNKILRARSTNPRTQLYAHAIKSGVEMQRATNKLLLRLQLCVYITLTLRLLLILAYRFVCRQQADLVVRKPQASSTSGQQTTGAGASESTEQ